MIRTRLLTLNDTPVELSIPDQVESHYSIVITNTSANKHAIIGNEKISRTNYGIRIEHDQPPVILENIFFADKLYGMSEDLGSTVPVSIMIIERN